MGTLAYALCQFNPKMNITGCDLEPAVSLDHDFRPSVEACPNQANVSFAVGDFFKPETIPKAELYVLSHVLHDWSEDKVDFLWSFQMSKSAYPRVILILMKYQHSLI